MSAAKRTEHFVIDLILLYLDAQGQRCGGRRLVSPQDRELTVVRGSDFLVRTRHMRLPASYRYTAPF